MRRVCAIAVLKPVHMRVFGYEAIAVEDADQAVCQPCAQSLADVLKRHEVVLVVATDVPIAIDFDAAPGYFRKWGVRKVAHHGRFIDVKQLTTSKSMRIGHGCVAVFEALSDRFVELFKAIELNPIEIAKDTRVDKLDGTLNCGFIVKCPGFCS